MHISSLPSPYGIGTMGKEARKFADFLEKSGQKYWQILPICPTSYGDSPYQSFSSFAGNPYFIDLEYLCKEKLLKKAECESFPWGKKADKVDYGVMYESRYKLLKIAFERFLRAEPDDFEAFCEKEADWLSDYALFMALKDANGGNAWFSWEKDLKMRKPEALAEARSTYAKDIRFYQMLQYLFFKQWWELKAYVNEKGIEIIGDVPIYVAGDSADVWANPEEFYLDEDLNPIEEAHAYERLIQEFNLTQDEVAERVSKSRTTVTNALRLLKLTEKVQQMLIDDMLSTGHVRALITIADPQLQYETAMYIFDKKLSVRETESYVKKLLNKKPKEKTSEKEDPELSFLYKAIENRLKESLGTKTTIKAKTKDSGKIEIEYYSQEDLERITQLLAQ